VLAKQLPPFPGQFEPTQIAEWPRRESGKARWCAWNLQAVG